MCTSIRMEAAATTANNGSKPLRRIRRRSPTTVAVDEEDSYCAQYEASAMLTSSPKNTSNEVEPTVAFCGKLNDVGTDSNQQETSTERRRAARRRRGDRASSRPDASGRIGAKECHILAFTEKFEEEVAKAMNEA